MLVIPITSVTELAPKLFCGPGVGWLRNSIFLNFVKHESLTKLFKFRENKIVDFNKIISRKFPLKFHENLQLLYYNIARLVFMCNWEG